MRLPSSIVTAVEGVVGLTNTVRLQSGVRPAARKDGGGQRRRPAVAASCETGYVTTAELFDRFVTNTSVSTTATAAAPAAPA